MGRDSPAGNGPPSLDYEEAHRRFLALEDDLSLFSARIDGVPFWERAHFESHRAAIRATTPLGEVHATVVDSPDRFLEAFESGAASPPADRTPFFEPGAIDDVETATADVRERERRD